VAYDIANSAPFRDIEPVDETLAVALVVTSPNMTGSNSLAKVSLSYCAASEETSHSSEAANPALNQLAAGNPIGTSMVLLETLAACVAGDVLQRQMLRFAAAPGAQVVMQF